MTATEVFGWIILSFMTFLSVVFILTAIDLAYSLLHDWREAKRWMADTRPCFGLEQSLRDTEWVTRMLSLRRRRQFH
jgi:hypothetical protein